MRIFTNNPDNTPHYINKFFNKIKFTDKCWEWHGGRGRYGHGVFSIGSKVIPAHRYSYQIYKGKIPDGLVIDHLCCNPPCVNPEHLESVTPHENVLRGRASHVRKKLTSNL